MLELYTAATPNGFKVSILLEELGLTYTVHPIDLSSREQKSDAFLKINPDGKIPVLSDSEFDLVLSESGSILLFYAQLHQRFLGTSMNGRAKTLRWLFWQTANIGPNFGQYFSYKYMIRPRNTDSFQRYSVECERLLILLDEHLKMFEYLNEEDFSIAEMALFPWMHSYKKIEPKWFINLHSINVWLERCLERPAVQRGLLVPPKS